MVRTFDVSFDVNRRKLWDKKWNDWWFDTPRRSCHHRNKVKCKLFTSSLKWTKRSLWWNLAWNTWHNLWKMFREVWTPLSYWFCHNLFDYLQKCYSGCLHYGLYNAMQVAIRISQGSSSEWRQISSLAIVYSTFLFRRRSKKTSKLCATGLCVGNSPVTGEFPAQMASNTENISIWWRHHVNTGLNRLLCIVYPITYARNFVVDFF